MRRVKYFLFLENGVTGCKHLKENNLKTTSKLAEGITVFLPGIRPLSFKSGYYKPIRVEPRTLFVSRQDEWGFFIVKKRKGNCKCSI